jgi:hypothetical protein
MSDYKAVYKNVGTTPRTYDQAFNTADYATALWKCETANEKGIRLIISWAVVVAVIIGILFSVYALLMIIGG